MDRRDEFRFFLENCSKSKKSFANYDGGLRTFVNQRLKAIVEGFTDIYDYDDPEVVEGFINALENDKEFTDRDRLQKSERIYSNSISSYLIFLKAKRFFTSTKDSQRQAIPLQQKECTKYRPFLAAIKSKPFVLLAGLSGTGKSRIVRELARACWEVDSEEYKAQKPRNFEMIQVKPNWHDSSELLGYVSRVSGKPEFVAGDFLRFIIRAWSEPDIPYFLCMDEMNLAPVEQYFAEYLSVIESRKVQEDGTISTDSILKDTGEEWYNNLIARLTKGQKTISRDFVIDGISLPQNLIVIGTVNMDETTYSFSRKVLDRAMTIEMNDFNIYGGLDRRYEAIGKLSSEELIGTAVEGVDVYADYKDVCDKALNYLSKVNKVLEGTPFSIAYRTRNELLLYVVNNLPYNKDEEGNELSEGYVIARALDEITNMKILSRIEGDDTKVSDNLLSDLSKAIEDGLKTIAGEERKLDLISLAKIEEMRKRLSSGHTSYWI